MKKAPRVRPIVAVKIVRAAKDNEELKLKTCHVLKRFKIEFITGTIRHFQGSILQLCISNIYD